MLGTPTDHISSFKVHVRSGPISVTIVYSLVSKSVPSQQINRIISYLSTQDEKLQTIHATILSALTTHDNGTCDISHKHDTSC